MSFDNGQISTTEYEFYKDDFKNIEELYPGMIPYVIEELRRYASMARAGIFGLVWKDITAVDVCLTQPAPEQHSREP